MPATPQYESVNDKISNQDERIEKQNQRLTDIENNIVGWKGRLVGVSATASLIFVVGLATAKAAGIIS